MNEYPTISFLRKALRYNAVKSLRPQILNMYIIGSEALGTGFEKSDLDVAVIIPKIKDKSSIQYTENYHTHFLHSNQKPKWNNRIIDFQFFFEEDDELKTITKIELL